MAEDIIKMSQKELRRLHVIKKVLEDSLRQVEAGEILCLSPRQIRRLARRVRLFGDIGIAHKLRGRCSSKRFPERLRRKAVKLYQQRYTGFGPTLAAEKIKEINGIKVSDETLRKWLIESGDWKKGRRKRVHRKWRERKHHFAPDRFNRGFR